jgi:hypothetical protein
VSNIRLGARIRTNSPQGSWIDDPANDQVISVDPGEKDYSRKFRIPSDVSSGYYDAGWVIVNQNTDEYQVAEAWVDEKVMYSALYISAQPVLAYPSIFRNGVWCVDTTGNHVAHIPHFKFIKILFHEFPTAMNLSNEVCYTNLHSYS